MAGMTQNQLDKLPVYAQNELNRLNYLVNALKDEISLLKGDTPSLINALDYGADDAKDRPIGDRKVVCFSTEYGKINVSLDSDHRAVNVRSEYGRIYVQPRAANSIEITTER